MRDGLSRAGHELACAVLVLAVKGPREVASHGGDQVSGPWSGDGLRRDRVRIVHLARVCAGSFE